MPPVSGKRDTLPSVVGAAELPEVLVEGFSVECSLSVEADELRSVECRSRMCPSSGPGDTSKPRVYPSFLVVKIHLFKLVTFRLSLSCGVCCDLLINPF